MRISRVTKFNYKTFNGQVGSATPTQNVNQSSPQQNTLVKKSNPLKQISTSTYIYSAAAVGLLVCGVILHHNLKTSPKRIKISEPINDMEGLEHNIQEETASIKTEERLDPKPVEELTKIENPLELDAVDGTFKKLESNANEFKESFKLDNSERKKIFEDFDVALELKEDNAENKVFDYLTNPDNSREAQNLIYDHMEKDYEPAYDSLVDKLYTCDAGRTFIPSLRVMAKRGNENDIKEIQKIMQTPNVSSMIYTNIAVSYRKLPKERFDKDIIPIFDGLYAAKKVALLQVFEAHKSPEYVPLLDSMSRIQGYESFIYPQIEHAKASCKG